LSYQSLSSLSEIKPVKESKKSFYNEKKLSVEEFSDKNQKNLNKHNENFYYLMI